MALLGGNDFGTKILWHNIETTVILDTTEHSIETSKSVVNMQI